MGMIITSLRPRQWTKNLVVFAGLIFSRNILNWSMQWKVWATFAAFCAVAGAGYILNDILDREKDRVHPIKKSRPIASGRLGIGLAGLVAAILVFVTMAAGYFVDPYLPLFLAAYLVLQVGYALVLKHLVIIDVLVISAGLSFARLPVPWSYTCPFQPGYS